MSGRQGGDEKSLVCLSMCYCYTSIHNNRNNKKRLNKLGNWFNINVFECLTNCHLCSVYMARVTNTVLVWAVILEAL